MKRLKEKKGFTLVECVVAMAVLAIMSLLLTMMLSVIMRIRNDNMKLERDIDQQIENLAVGAGVKEGYDKGIEFGSDFTIPGNTAENVSANKVSGDSDGVSKLEFDFSKYFDAMGDPPKLGSDKDADKVEVGDWEKTSPCFGSIDLKGTVQIIEEKTLNADNIYDVKWTVNFTVNSYYPVDSIKITLPVGSKFKSWSTPEGTEKKATSEEKLIGYTRKITPYIVMIQPDAGNANPDGVHSELSVKVYLNFTISEDDYKTNCGNLAKYFNVGDFPAQMSVDIIPTNT